MIRDMWSAWVQGFIGGSPPREARGHARRRSAGGREKEGPGVGGTVCKGVLRDTWVTTLQKSTSIFHHTELFGVSQCEVKLRALVVRFQLTAA